MTAKFVDMLSVLLYFSVCNYSVLNYLILY